MRGVVCMRDAREREALCQAIQLWAGLICLKAEITAQSPEEAVPAEASLLLWDMDGTPALPAWEGPAGGRWALLLCSSQPQAAIESYAIHPNAFFQKPVPLAALCQALERCVARWWEDLEWVEVLCGGARRRIPLCDLLWAESYQHGALLHTTLESIQTRESLRDLTAHLPERTFFRCQRGYVVNLYHIRGIGQTSARLANGAEIPIGRRARGEVLEAYRRSRWIWESAAPPEGSPT